ncbi:MAG: response regulator [Chloroherpetonaceae bacterium]|nr:response regulator [Chloroherpetonaceae bacterium]
MVNERNKFILVVDDENYMSEILCEALSDAGFKAQFVLNGIDALQIFQDQWQDIDLVVLDMRLPDITGLDLYSRMREIHPKVKILFSAGYLDDADIYQLKKNGVESIFIKPFALSSFIFAVENLLSAKM